MSIHHSSRGVTLAVVNEPGGTQQPGTSLVLELSGPAGSLDAETVGARLARRHRDFSVVLDSHDSGHHTLRLTPSAVRRGPLALPAELLADLLAPCQGDTETMPVTGHQRELLLSALAGEEGDDRHIGQLFWTWSGALDVAQFISAWQSVFDREAVLRAAFDWVTTPRLVVHARADVDVVRHAGGTLAWEELLERDRRRGFEPYRPGQLRLTLLDMEAGGDGQGGVPTRVLLTYHRALLDERGVRILLREFYRAYTLGGVLPGSERRPDIRDHAAWLAAQDTTAARAFWTQALPPGRAAISPGRPRALLGWNTGRGRCQTRLRMSQTARLRAWSAALGAGESSALHVVWALLLYRASGGGGPLAVCLGVHVSGCDITLPGAAGIPGLLGGPLPLNVTVDPAGSLADLVREARDRLLDITAYPWVSADRIRAWTGQEEDAELFDIAVRFDGLPELPARLRREPRVQQVRPDPPRGPDGDTVLPVTVLARPDPEGGLVLTTVYDRASMADADASTLHGQCVHLLRTLPDLRDPQVTVGQVLELLGTSDVPGVAPRRAWRGLALTTLRSGEPGADIVCLVTVPGVTPGSYDLFVRAHEGPECIVVLRLDGGRGALPAELGQALGSGGRRLILCGCGPASRAAYAIAADTAAGADVPVTVVMTGFGSAADSASALALGLRSAVAKDC
ncbi:condensation domain-containing protein [Streptomyces sp. NBC_00986]|uniref:condensation domain-containing protein n=1 Tax=Streptomyces sp. NBC_00986 TaxID=2903702 RepID=UPI00386B9CCE|nr:condensation domain-containing protein [Streptomyces sp. NBC_00986]WSX64470.1 condensation domain-containing protein [Streptomyces sp. NBC_00986]